MLTAPISWVYRQAIGRRNRGFDAGKGVVKLDRPVISVGNLSTGGTGKSPMVHLIVGMLREQGHTPVIAMRGYGAKPGQKGDEQLEHERELPGVPVVAQPDRVAGLRAYFGGAGGGEVDCVVLDDGFQHRRIARDLDIVLIDASRPPDRDALLPRGHLREPMDSLARAGLVVLTHAERVEAAELDRLRSLVSRYSPSCPVRSARHAWHELRRYCRTADGWEEEVILPDHLRGMRARVVCGIGNAGALVDMVRGAGIEPTGVICLRDHARIDRETIEGLMEPQNPLADDPVLMTRKDWVKADVSPAWPPGSRVIVPCLRMEIDDVPMFESLIRGPFGRAENDSH